MNFKAVLSYNARQDGTREVRIYAYMNNKKKYFPTGIKIQPSHWNKKLGLVKNSHPLHRSYNAIIKAERNRVEEHFLNGGGFSNINTSKQGRELLAFTDDFLQECYNGQHGYSEATIKIYKSFRKRLHQYCEHYNLDDIPFDKVDMVFYAAFSKFLVEHCNCTKPGIGKHIKKLKRIMQLAMERNLHKNAIFKTKEFKAPQQKSKKIYLTESEIEKLESLHLENKALKKERDRFLLAYYLLMRYSDVCNIKKEGVFYDNGRPYYQYSSEKTDIPTIIPLNSKALQLIETYNYDFRYTANQVANRNLKIISAKANITADVSQGNQIYKKYELVTFHTARRSGATNLRLQGASLKTIADLGGWKDIQTLVVYLRASGLDSARMASDLEFFR